MKNGKWRFGVFGVSRRKLAALVLAGCGLAGGTAWAQQGGTTTTTDLPPKTYMKQSVFYLPVKIDDRVRATLREVRLYYKEGPERAWDLKEKASPGQTYFTFRAPHDGEYWFMVATMDKNGRTSPADIRHEPPGLIVVQDTQLPNVDVRPLGMTDDGTVVQCVIRDANPDTAKTHLYYQTGDMLWRPLNASANQPDQYCIPAQAVFTGMVRVEASDLAGNTMNREFNVGAMPMAHTKMPAGQKVVQTGFSNETVVTTKSGSPSSDTSTRSNVDSLPASQTRIPNQLPIEQIDSSSTKVHKTASGPELMPVENSPSHRAIETVSEGPIGSATRRPSEPEIIRKTIETTVEDQKAVTLATQLRKTPEVRHLVNKTHVFLQYQVENKGPSGLGTVTVYITRDQGQTWEKMDEEREATGTIDFDLPGDGLYGVSLAVKNGRGFGGNPPGVGDSPDWWIEVDLIKPSAELLEIKPGSNGTAACVFISWTARDKNLASEPIDLWYAVSRDGPWQPVAKNLKNDGRYCWNIPANLGPEAYIRLTARDAAGNITTCETAQAVTLDDLSRPRARVTSVGTAPPHN